MVDQKTIEQAASLLLQAAPGSQVILFGSYARGQATEDSDLDFLVIEPEVRDRHAEMNRLQLALRGLRLAVDVLVTSRQIFEEWHDTPNNVYYEAAKEGRVFSEVAWEERTKGDANLYMDRL